MPVPPSFRYNGPLEAKSYYFGLAAQQMEIHHRVMSLGPLPLGVSERRVLLPDGTRMTFKNIFGRDVVTIDVPESNPAGPEKLGFEAKGWFQLATVPFDEDGTVLAPWQHYLVTVSTEGGVVSLKITQDFNYISSTSYLRTLESWHENIGGDRYTKRRFFTSCISQKFDIPIYLIAQAEIGSFHPHGFDQKYITMSKIRTKSADETYAPVGLPGSKRIIYHRGYEEEDYEHTYESDDEGWYTQIYKWEPTVYNGENCFDVWFAGYWEAGVIPEDPEDQICFMWKWHFFYERTVGWSWEEVSFEHLAEGSEALYYYVMHYENPYGNYNPPGQYLDLKTRWVKTRWFPASLLYDDMEQPFWVHDSPWWKNTVDSESTAGVAMMGGVCKNFPGLVCGHPADILHFSVGSGSIPHDATSCTYPTDALIQTIMNGGTQFEVAIDEYKGPWPVVYDQKHILMASSCALGQQDNPLVVNVFRYRDGTWRMFLVDSANGGMAELTQQFEAEFAKTFPERTWVPRNVAYAITYPAFIEDEED